MPQALSALIVLYNLVNTPVRSRWEIRLSKSKLYWYFQKKIVAIVVMLKCHAEVSCRSVLKVSFSFKGRKRVKKIKTIVYCINLNYLLYHRLAVYIKQVLFRTNTSILNIKTKLSTYAEEGQ